MIALQSVFFPLPLLIHVFGQDFFVLSLFPISTIFPGPQTYLPFKFLLVVALYFDVPPLFSTQALYPALVLF